MLPLPPLDDRGRDLAVGDWVRLVAVPPDLGAAPEETRAVFAAALGRTFRIEEFNGYGLARLDVTRRPPFDTIWVEPAYLRRSRRTTRCG